MLTELKHSNSSMTWPPNMEVIAKNLKAIFEDLYKQSEGQVNQIPNYVEMRTWDGDQKLLFKKDTSTNLSNIKSNAKLTRKALEPITLERISRECVRVYLKEILNSVNHDEKQAFAIIGDAGYGKTTILGDIYDSICSKVSWVTIVRCDNLRLEQNLSDDSLAMALGNYVSDSNASDSIIDIASSLTKHCGRGVLLIDTLDIVLNQAFIEPFHHVLEKLTNESTTVVFTCRDYEYDNILQPERYLYRLSSNVKRHPVPPFSPEEIIRAAAAFSKKSKNFDSISKGEEFGRKIVELSTHDYQLREIIKKPLLLRILCELFEEDGSVPENLTASNLYQRYWNERIAKLRLNCILPGEVLRETVGRRQKKLCQNIAKIAFEDSYDRLEVLVNRSDVEEIEEFDQIYDLAYKNMESEGVLITEKKQIDLVRFFHQSFMEFAIAKWLNTAQAKDARERLLETLRNPNAWFDWWRIMREYLTLAKPGQFERIIADKLDMSNERAFYAIAFAAASRSELSALEKLLPTALERGIHYQQILFDAAISTPVSNAETAWKVVLTLLEKGDYKIAAKITQNSREMLARLKPNLGSCINAALEAIEKRPMEGTDAQN
ncbi:MAG: ATP-binding protein [Okeania sp. SIO2D1]|nr:ATP-binding protein [Okeania sp. SIO2D1]